MRRGLLAAAAGAALAFSVAPAVRAQVPPPTATVNVTSPKPDGSQIFGGPATTSGTVHADGAGGATVLWVKATLAWAKQGAPPPMPHPIAICGVAPGADPNPAPPTCQGTGTSDVTFTNAPLPVPAFNGPYQLVLTAHVQDGLNQAADFTNNNVKFGMAAKPANVSNLKVSAKSRVVTLGWDRNGEADLTGYDVFRQAPGEKPPKDPIVRVLQPDDGTRVTFIDDGAPAPGGEYIYAVLALRPGETGDIKTSHLYSPNPAVVKVTLPPGTPQSTTPPTQPGAKGGPSGPPTIKGTGSNAPRLSSASAATSPSTTEAVAPDPGFVRDLPYGATTIPGEEGDDSASVAINQESGKSKSNQRGLLVPAATGAILFVAAFQLRYLKKRLEEPPTPLT